MAPSYKEKSVLIYVTQQDENTDKLFQSAHLNELLLWVTQNTLLAGEWEIHYHIDCFVPQMRNFHPYFARGNKCGYEERLRRGGVK